MSDLKKHQYTMESCNHCGQCKWILPARMTGWDFAEICPIHMRYSYDAYSGQGMLNMAREVSEGKLSCSEGMMKLAHACTACGACDINCKNVKDMEVLEVIYELRAECAEQGFVPEPVKRTAENVKQTHNIYGLPHADRFAWLPADYEDDPGADTILFVGCSAYRYPETALAAIKILKAGGVRFRLLGEDEWCCGGSMWRSGLHEEAGELIRRNLEVFRAQGVKTVITACAECFGSFRGIYPRFEETEIEFRHITEVADELISQGRLTLKGVDAPLKVTYHDPCMLGRLSEKYVPWEGKIRSYGLHVPEKKFNRGEFGVYEPPRRVLDAIPGIDRTEMIRYKEETFCCGAPSRETDPELARFARDERLREAEASGAEAVVSCCPFCRDALSGGTVRYLDLTELIAEHI
ncbi:MAG: (Fe-S)-binding protein [Lachnospiraceae bacterium]|nr:(Fe-S)-binding protein [Lachnospiraceae bacterium]